MLLVLFIITGEYQRKIVELISVNCPFNKRTANGIALVPCDRVCVKVYPGSAGEVWCRSCKLKFNFEVDAQSNYKTKVVAQKVK